MIKQFKAITDRKSYLSAKKYYEKVVASELKEHDITIPADERILYAPSLQSMSTGNWGTAWHGTHVHREWIKENAQRKVAVFVLDTGAGFTNEHLDAAWWREKSKSFTGEQNEIDVQSHSTHVAGIIAAVDPQKPIGLAEELVKKGLLKIIPYKVLTDNGSGSLSGIAAGIDSAIAESIELQKEGWFCIINMSLGGSGQSSVLDNACTRASDAGLLVFAAAGNGGSENVGTPANGPDAIAVAAITEQGNRAGYSDYGQQIETAGAGSLVLSTLPNNGEGRYSGTSMATPSTAACAAIIASTNPDYDASQVKAALLSRVFDIQPAGWDKYTGFGTFLVDELINNPEEPEQPEQPEDPEEEEPINFTSKVKTVFDGFVFRYKSPSDSNFRLMKINDLVVEASDKMTEEDLFDAMSKLVSVYFSNTAMGIPDDPKFGFETTAWWIGQFLEYQARQKGSNLQVFSLKATSEKGRVCIAEGFSKAIAKRKPKGLQLFTLA